MNSLEGFRGCLSRVVGLLVLLTGVATVVSAEPAALSLHPDNPKYFLFRGKPTVLIAASEHYGSVLNRPFDFRKYLADQADKRMTMTRTFLQYRELASPMNPASPCKPKPEDYIAPWPRSGPGKALDGQPKFDLNSWNEEYFKRLHEFLDFASERGIIVELTVFSNTYGDSIWAMNPLRAENNNQGVGKISWEDYTSLKDKALLERQLAYARKIVQETAGYDNVYYEICNEPGGGVAGHVTPADVDAWQLQVARVLREEMAKLHRPHLLAGFEAFNYSPRVTTTYDGTFAKPLFDIVNVHPLPDSILGGHNYQMGNFMSKELRLADLIDFGKAAWKQPKPCVWDEDNAASMFTTPVGWTIHRKRAWTALLGGSHYDMIDFSIQIGRETGTPESNAALRTWFKHLSAFFHSIDFVHGAPHPEIVRNVPFPARAVAFGVEGKDYAIYLADAREAGEAGLGDAIHGGLILSLPAGRWSVTIVNPMTGETSRGPSINGGESRLTVPEFRHDVALRVTRD